MSEILISEYINDSAVQTLRTQFDVHYDETLVERPEELARRAATCRALIVRNRTQVTAELLDACPGLLAIGRLGVGLDNVDMEACRARHIQVFPAIGANVVSVAEYVIAAILIGLRGAYHASTEVLAGSWPRTRHMGREASGKSLGIVGFGAIGREVARRATVLGMRVLAHDAFVVADDPIWQECAVQRRDFTELLAESDVVTLHVPLDDETYHLIDAKALAAMKAGAFLINTARGGVVDEGALAAALRAGKLGGAMLDVFEDEPLPAGSHLDGVPRLHLTPHIAGLTEEANERVGGMVARRVAEVLSERS